MADSEALKQQLIAFMEKQKADGADAATVYAKASTHAMTLADAGTPEMKDLMLAIEDWVSRH